MKKKKNRKRRKTEWEEHETEILGMRKRAEEARWETEREEAQRLRRENKFSRGLQMISFLLLLLLFFNSFFLISWRLITLQYCSGFCQTLT